MSEKKICPNCKAENDAEYSFCKICGFYLGGEPKSNPTYGSQPFKENSNNTYYSEYQFYREGEIDGVSNKDISTFIGTNGDSYIKKFYNMNLLHKKSGWNWAVFLFGFLLNIPFVWFFYRKMKKAGAILLAISLVFSILQGAVLYSAVKIVSDVSATYFSEQGKDIIKYAEELYGDESIDEDVADRKIDNAIDKSIYNFFKAMPSKYGVRVAVLTAFGSILSILQLFYIIMVSVFANNIYKNHCVKTIKSIPTDSDTPLELLNLGGTSNGLAITFGVIFKLLEFIVGTAIVFIAAHPLISYIMSFF